MNRSSRFHRSIALSILLITAGLTHAQSDSLWSVWSNLSAPDSSRLQAIQQLSWKAVFEHPDSGMALANKQLELAIRVNDAKARYEAYTTLAVGSSMRNDQVAALDYLEQGLRTARAMNDRQREANTYSNRSNVYRSIGDLPLALDQLQQSLRIDLELDNKEGLAGTYNNIGNIHKDLGDLPKALEHYQRSASLYEALGDRKGRAQALMNLGATHLDLGERTQALEEFLGSLGLYRELGMKHQLGMAYNNLGRTYGELGRDRDALVALDSAFFLFNALGRFQQLARNHYYRGLLFVKQGNALAGKVECAKGLQLARNHGLAQQRKECSECLMRAYEHLGDLANAFHAQKEFMQVSDSLEVLNNSKEVQRLDLQRQFQDRQITDSLTNVRERYEQELAHRTQLGRERNRRNVLLFSAAGILLLAGGLWNRLRFVRRSRAEIQREKDRSDDLLHNILPEEVATELKVKGHAKARQFEQVTVLFTDFKGFTQVSERLSPADLVEELNACFKAFDGIMDQYGIEKIKTIGDAYMAAGGIPVPSPGSTKNAVLAALEMQAFIAARKILNTSQGRPSFEMRVGLHTGPVVAGIVGVKKFAYDIWGDTVNTASRMESSGEVGQVNISEATYALVKDVVDSSPFSVVSSPRSGLATDNSELTTRKAFTFTPRGKVQAKGKGEMEMYFVQACTTA